MTKAHLELGDFLDAYQPIFEAEPFICDVSTTYDSAVCHNCYLMTGEDLQRCASCQQVFYCSKDCQVSAWKSGGHKKECARLKKLIGHKRGSFTRIMLKLILKLQKKGHEERGYYSKSKYMVFNDLIEDRELILNIDIIQRELPVLLGNYKTMFDAEERMSEDDFVDIFCKVYANLIWIRRFTLDESKRCYIGVGIYLNLALVKHDCDANSTIFFEGKKMFLRSKVAMPSYDVTKLRIRLYDPLVAREVRINVNNHYFRFNCNCKTCLKEPLIKCPNDKCDQPFSMENQYCSKCKAPMTEERREKITVLFCENVLFLSNPIAAGYTFGQEVYKRQKQLLHRHDLERIITLRHLFFLPLVDIRFAKYSQTSVLYNYGIEFVKSYQYYYNDHDEQLGNLYHYMCQLAIRMNNHDRAVEFMKKCEQEYNLAFGGECVLANKAVDYLKNGIYAAFHFDDLKDDLEKIDLND